MIIYRSHRGSLEEAMKTVAEFDNLEELKLHVCDEHNSIFGIEMLRPDDDRRQKLCCTSFLSEYLLLIPDS